jgi:hypothetical protein
MIDRPTVCVLNFGAYPPGPGFPTGGVNAVSRLCGADTSRCPPGLATGDPISPATGYQSNALQRMTAGAVDPSDNLWVTNNEKIDVDPFQNPGGNAVVDPGRRRGAGEDAGDRSAVRLPLTATASRRSFSAGCQAPRLNVASSAPIAISRPPNARFSVRICAGLRSRRSAFAANSV